MLALPRCRVRDPALIGGSRPEKLMSRRWFDQVGPQITTFKDLFTQVWFFPDSADACDGPLGGWEKVTPGEALGTVRQGLSTHPGFPGSWQTSSRLWGSQASGRAEGRVRSSPRLGCRCAGSALEVQCPRNPHLTSRADRAVGPGRKGKLLDPAPGSRWWWGEEGTHCQQERGRPVC